MNKKNSLRYTGYYKGVRVSVVGTGMGQASHAIYITELITHYGVKKVIRIGSCGTVCYPRIKIGDLVLGVGAGTDSNMNRMKFLNLDHSATADFDLLATAVKVCEDVAGGKSMDFPFRLRKVAGFGFGSPGSSRGIGVDLRGGGSS